MLDIRDAKSMAKRLRSALADKGADTLTHSEALEIVACQFGFATWNVLSARLDKDELQDGFRFEAAVPIIRIFDVAKAQEFYVGFLGFKVDWEHRYGDDFPLYFQVSRGGLRLHLSEHAGDASPGGNSCVYMSGLKAYHAELTAKNYRYMRPGVDTMDGRMEMQITDPFNNRIRFMELLS